MSDGNDLVAELRKRVHAPGFEVFGATCVGDYNQTLEPQLRDYRLPELGNERALVVVIGNARRLWPLFLEAYAQRSLREEAHPLDAYSRLHLGTAVEQLAQEHGVQYAMRFSFDAPPHAVAIQRLAGLAGVAEPSPVGLCVHPQHGPWFSLRAAVVFGVQGPGRQTPPATCSACTARPCLLAREKMLAATGGVFTRETFDANWQSWLAMRDACPVGRAARYSDRQIRYHYLKERSALDEPQP